MREFREDRARGIIRPPQEYLGRLAPEERSWASEIILSTDADGPSQLHHGAPLTEIRSLGPYRLMEPLGRGGQGTVFLSEDTRVGRKVALKVLDARPGVDDSRRDRFRREAEAVARLDHPGICTLLDVDLDGDPPYIVVRYIEGKSLRDHIDTETEVGSTTTWMTLCDDGPEAADATLKMPQLPTPSTLPAAGIRALLATVEKVALALHAAHEAGVIHRDIKPGNIIVDGEGEPFILDFGLAHLDDPSKILTEAGDVLGTPAYMSPEQLEGSGSVDRRTDIWSLGVCLYECCALRRPFDAATRANLYQRIAHEDPPSLLAVNPSVPRDLCSVIERALEKEPDRRYATAREFADDLACVRTGRPTLARPLGFAGRALRWARRHPVRLGVISLLVVLLAALVIVELQRRESFDEGVDAVAVFQRWQEALANGEQTSPEDARAVERLIADAETLDFVSKNPNSPAAWSAFLRRVKDTARSRGGLLLLEPRATVVTSRPTFRFTRVKDDLSPWQYRICLYDEDLQRREALVPTDLTAGEDVIAFPWPEDPLDVQGGATGTTYSWTVELVDARRGRVRDDEYPTVTFKAIAPEARADILDAVTPSGDANLDQVLRAYALLSHGLADDARDLLESWTLEATHALSPLRRHLLAMAVGMLGDVERAEKLR